MLRFLTAGESHGPALTAVIEGFPAGVELTKGKDQYPTKAAAVRLRPWGADEN